MPEIAKYLQNEGIIYVEGFGEVTYNDVKNTIEFVNNVKNSFNINNILSDHLKVESVPNEVDVFNLGSISVQRLKEFNLALIYPPKLKEYYKLFEKTANRRGGNIKLFKNKDSAQNWLRSLKKTV